MNTQWKRNCPKCNRELVYTTKGSWVKTTKNKSLCKRCFKTSNIEEFIIRSRQLHGFKYNYSMADYINAKTKVKIVCSKHGMFYQSPDAHLRGQGCPQCKHEFLDKFNTSTLKEFIERSSRIHNNKYDYSKSEYIKCKSKIAIICHKHGLFYQIAGDHLNGHGCPKCISIISDKEKSFLDYLQIPDTKENRQVLIARKKVDGMRCNTIFEFLGDYWHGNPLRFDANDCNEICKKTYGELYNETFQRFKKLKTMGYDVKYIWEFDWEQWSKDKSSDIPIRSF